MMKKIVLSFVWICGCFSVVYAQLETNNRILNQAAIGYRISSDASYARALTLAKQRGWPLTIKGSGGKVAMLDGVDKMDFPMYIVSHNNAIAAATTRANQLWPGGASGLNLSGSSANMKDKIGLWEAGNAFPLKTHVELINRINQKDNPAASGDHATHVAGTLIASGVNPAAKGMAFGVQSLVSYDTQQRLAEMFTESPNLLISNHSYGFPAGWSYNDTDSRWEFWGLPTTTEDYKFGFYSDESQTLDSLAYNAPNYLMVFSAGNNRGETGPAIGDPYFRLNSSGTMVSGGNRLAGISSNDSYDCIPTINGAKNILTVGAVNGIPVGYSRKEDVVMSYFSSWGPTDDGRIKPDIVADGVAVLSPINTSNTSYASFDGTSMASPNAAGSLFLLQEYYSKLKAGAFLRSATIKGLAIHTANEAGSFPGPDYQFGWGLLNVEKAAAVITAAVPSNNAATSAHLVYEKVINNGETFSTTVVASGKQSLSATISWTDPKGSVDPLNTLNSRVKNLVNDLDIRITTGSGASLRTYLPWTLDVNNPSAAAVPGDNITDNVEKIELIDSTIPGQTYTITVSHKGTLARGLQAYSLLVSGVGGVPYCASASGGGGARIDSVSFKAIQKANTAGSKAYTNNTNLIANIEPSQSIPIFIKVGTADLSSNPRIVKVFIDYNNNGVFDAGELAAQSLVISTAAGSASLTITTPSTLIVGANCLMRIIVQETSTASDILACGPYGKGETQDYRVRVVDPSVDMSLSQIVSPASSDCSSPSQYVTIKIRNNGTIDQSNIPVSVAISTGGITVANLSGIYPGTISALSTVNYTFQTPFISNAGTTYTLTATVNLTGDQYSANNQLVVTIITASKPATISGIGEICTTTAFLRVNTPDASNYFWYATPSATSSFALGANVSTASIPADKTFYVAKEARASLGPLNKLAFPQGGYNSFFNNYIKFNNTVPIVIETAKLYIGYPGKIIILAADITNVTSTGFSFKTFAGTVLDAYATNPSPATGAVSGNPSNDTGAVYYLNLPVTSVGDHILLIRCVDKNGNQDTVTNLNATIFRNNGITGATYPISVPNIASITGNSVNQAGFTEAQFYYFYYDMRINTFGCVSDKVPVVAVTAPTPVITQVADSLLSSIAGGNQWYLNDTAINNASNNHYKPTKAGTYKVIVTDVFGCQKISNTIAFTVTAIPELVAQEIKLKVSPNPNSGVFNLSFEVTTKADLSIDILSSSGQRVYNSSYPNFTGKFSKQIRVDPLSTAFYVLKIQHNKKTYLQKILIEK